MRNLKNKISKPVTNCNNNKYVNPDYYSVVVVQTLQERDNIPCKLRQNGTIAIVVERGYAQYQIQTEDGFYSVCNNNAWTQIETGDKVFDGNNLIIINNEEHKQEYLLSPLAIVGQMLFYVPENKYYKYDGVDFVDPFLNKLDKPLGSTMDPDNKLIPVYGQSGDNPEWLSSNTLGKVESVNGVGVTQGTKNINLNLSDIPDNVGYATDAELTQLSITQATALNTKLDKTTTTVAAPDTTFKYAYLTDENNNVRRMLAGDLGKNIANSNLTSVAGAGVTLGAPYILTTNGQPFSVTGLADKSADSTFDRFKVQNSTGVEAVVTNPYQIMKKGFELMTTSQALELGQLLNGGSGSAGAMSVNLISPPIVEKINSNEYIMLRGANLNLNATAKKIEILDSTSRVVIATVPDNQIQLYADATQLIFYYNFINIPYGIYVIRLTSGSKVYETTLTLAVVSNVNLISTNTITWEIQNSVTVPAQMIVSQGGGNLYLDGSPTTTNSPVIAFKSSEIFAQGKDFYLEINVTAGSNPASSGVSDASIRNNIGLGYSSTVNTLLDNTLIKTAMGHYEGIGIDVYNNAQSVYHNLGPYSYTVIFIKTGNLFRTIIGSTNQSVILSNNSGYSIFLNLCRLKSNFNSQFSIIKAYTFN